MRHIKIYLEDDVFNGLEKEKKDSGLTWEQFIVQSVWANVKIKSVKIDSIEGKNG